MTVTKGKKELYEMKIKKNNGENERLEKGILLCNKRMKMLRCKRSLLLKNEGGRLLNKRIKEEDNEEEKEEKEEKVEKKKKRKKRKKIIKKEEEDDDDEFVPDDNIDVEEDDDVIVVVNDEEEEEEVNNDDDDANVGYGPNFWTKFINGRVDKKIEKTTIEILESLTKPLAKNFIKQCASLLEELDVSAFDVSFAFFLHCGGRISAKVIRKKIFKYFEKKFSFTKTNNFSLLKEKFGIGEENIAKRLKEWGSCIYETQREALKAFLDFNFNK